MFYISSPFGLSCPAHLSISSAELITFQLFCSFQPLTIGTDASDLIIAWNIQRRLHSCFLVCVYSVYILFIVSRIGFFFLKRREIVIELVHHIRPPMRTQDRDNYKKKHPDIWNGKNHSFIVLLVQNEIIRTYWRNILYVTAHTAGDILRGQFK